MHPSYTSHESTLAGIALRPNVKRVCTARQSPTSLLDKVSSRMIQLQVVLLLGGAQMHRDGDSLILCLQGSMQSAGSLQGVCLNAKDCRMHGSKPMANGLMCCLCRVHKPQRGGSCNACMATLGVFQAQSCSAVVTRISPSSPSQMQDSKALAEELHRQHLSAQSCRHKQLAQHDMLPHGKIAGMVSDAAGLEQGTCPVQPQA